MSIDPRLAERRLQVAEDRARRRLGRLVRVLVVAAVLGGAAWVLLSPLLSVEEVAVTGVAASETGAVLLDRGVIPGTPMILIRTGKVERAIEGDPWVKQAVIELDWPSRVLVKVEERVPIAWVETASGWGAHAVDGVRLYPAGEPDGTLPLIRLAAVPTEDAVSSPEILGALQFVDALTPELRDGVGVGKHENGELWAEVAGFQVRLGRPVEMSEKALSLAALLREQPPPGSVLTLIAPTHPAITPP